jgi:hypothetical protein
MALGIDVHNNVKTVNVVAAVAGAATGKVIDRAGYAGCEFIISYGSVTATNATITPVVKDGSVTGTMTSVADGFLLGTESAAGIAAAATRTSGVSKIVAKRIGYIGTNRYVQCNILQTVTAAAPVSVVALLTRPYSAPVAT